MQRFCRFSLLRYKQLHVPWPEEKPSTPLETIPRPLAVSDSIACPTRKAAMMVASSGPTSPPRAEGACPLKSAFSGGEWTQGTGGNSWYETGEFVGADGHSWRIRAAMTEHLPKPDPRSSQNMPSRLKGKGRGARSSLGRGRAARTGGEEGRGSRRDDPEDMLPP